MNASDENNASDEDICKELGLAPISVPQLLHNPLPLQCLAAEALPSDLKQEIEQLTTSSIREVKRSSSTSVESYKRDSGTCSEEAECEHADKRESIVSVPLQFFSNSGGLRIVGGVSCSRSSDKHAQLMYISGRKDRENIPEQVMALHGQCIVEFNGHSLKGATFESVRRIVKQTKDVLVNLTLTQCNGGLNRAANPSDSGSTTTDSGGLKNLPLPPTLKLNPLSAKTQSGRLFRRRYSVGEVSLGNNSNNSNNSTVSSGCSKGMGSKTKSNTTLAQASNDQSASPPPSVRKKTSLDNSRLEMIPAAESPKLRHLTPISGSPLATNAKRMDDKKQDTLPKEESGILLTGENGIDGSPKTRLTKLKGSSNQLNALSMEMPNGMIKLGFNYVKAHKTLYVSLYKVKYHSLTIGSEPSGCFFNTYIFPDKREQGVKFSKIIPSTLSTEEVYTHSASYILTENEIKNTSIRVILWEQSSQAFGSKSFTFKGEVFLALNDEEIVNLHGVIQTYSISDPDPNLPPVPKAHYVSSGSGGGRLMKKMMDSTLGVMSLKRNKKKASSTTLPDLDKTDGTSDTSSGKNNIAKMLEPLKSKAEIPDTPTLNVSTEKPEPEPPVMCPVMLRPATTEDRPGDANGLSLVDFLNSLNGPSSTKVKETKTTIPQQQLGLPAKSPLFSSYQDLRSSDSSEPGNHSNERRSSVISDGAQSVSNPLKPKQRGTINSLFSSFGRSRIRSQSSSRYSMLTDSDLSSSISSLSAMDKQKDGVNGSQCWGEDSDSSSRPEVCYSEVTLPVPSTNKLASTASNHSLPIVTATNTSMSPLHSSIVFRPSPSPSYTSSTDSLSRQGDTQHLDSSNSSIHDGSYSCEQVPVLSSDPESTEPTMGSSDTTVTNNNSPSVNSISADTVKTTSHLSPLDLSPAIPKRLFPVNSTPKKSPTGSADSTNMPLSKSLGNMADMLFFIEDSESDITSLSEFMEKELSCLDTSDFNTDHLMNSQESTSSLTSSQREAMECSANSSSLDYSSSSQPLYDTAYPPSQDTPSSDQERRRRFDPTVRMTFGNPSELMPLPSSTTLSYVPKHKWSSLDDLSTSTKISTKSPKSPAKHSKKQLQSLTQKLSLAYTNGKVCGTVKLSISARCVTSQISILLEDIVFFDQKLMNTEFNLRVNLYNSVTEKCEKSLKGRVSLKKNHMEEAKLYLPSSFLFKANPMMYYIQIILQVSNKLFGKRKSQVWIDIKKLVSKSSEHTDWFNLTLLSV